MNSTKIKAFVHMAYATYFCPDCGDNLMPDRRVLVHRTHVSPGGGKPRCPNAGRTFRRPTVELEEVRR